MGTLPSVTTMKRYLALSCLILQAFASCSPAPPAAAPTSTPTAEAPAAPAATEAPADPWAQLATIESRIVPPTFPARDCPITDHGAVAGGEKDATEAIRKAIAACSSQGGGRVVVPPGVFLTGAIHLENNINLHVSEGATLRFSTDPAAYLPVVLTRWEGIECMNY